MTHPYLEEAIRQTEYSARLKETALDRLWHHVNRIKQRAIKDGDHGGYSVATLTLHHIEAEMGRKPMEDSNG